MAGDLQILRAPAPRETPEPEGATMAEVLVQLDSPVSDARGRAYVARVCGRVADDGLWEGWIEFDPRDGSPVLRSPRETEQPNRADLEYWATGLTLSYLEGALQRALRPPTPDLRPRTVDARPAYDGPAPPPGAGARAASPPPRAVLDPFRVFAQGEEVLRQELGALDEGHLRSIVRAYGIGVEEGTDPATLGRGPLVEAIVRGARRRAG
jgi:hypothetical protein